MVATKSASPECGHPSEHAAQAEDALKKIPPTTEYQFPQLRAEQKRWVRRTSGAL